MAGLKTVPNDGDVEAFLDGVEDPVRRGECREVLALMRELTGEEPRMWGESIVGFGRYRYRYESGRTGEWFLTGFSPRKKDLTLYVLPGLDAFAEVTARLGRFRTGRSCLYLKRLDDVDRQALRELVSRGVAALEPKRVRDTERA